MGDSDSEDLPLSIPLKAVSEHFTCPICMERLQQTHITPCGHRYCGKCITECINRRSKCPCCNKTVTSNKLYPDWAFDNLISMVAEEKNKAQNSYFERLIQHAVNNEGADHLSSHGEISPIEGVLQKHLKVGLASHQLYFQELQQEFSRQVQKIDSQIAALQEGDDESLAVLLHDLEEQKQRIHTELRTCTQLLVSAYDKHLTDHLPTPSLLPVTIAIRLQGKEVRLQDVQLKPHSSLSELKELFLTNMVARGDPVLSFPDEQVQYVLLGPFEKGRDVMPELLEELSLDNTERSDVISLLPRGCHPVIEFGITPGSEVVLVGPIKLKSDLPKQCFAQTFTKDGEETMDYFTCKDCAFNWVCCNCKDQCHKNHTTVPYIMGHRPTWACCYCPRKKKCKLVDAQL